MKIVYLYTHKVELLFQRLFKKANPLISLISDEELRRRCSDLLAAQNDYDRVIQQACLVLENRVRKAIGADASVVGADLMGQAFNPSSGLLRLSDRTAEQKGIMFIYNDALCELQRRWGEL